MHVEGKGNVIADKTNETLSHIMDELSEGQRQEHYAIKDGCMLMHGFLCVTKQ